MVKGSQLVSPTPTTADVTNAKFIRYEAKLLTCLPATEIVSKRSNFQAYKINIKTVVTR